MGQRLDDNIHFIRLLIDPSTKRKQKKELIKTSTTEQLKTVLEVLGNVLYGNVQVDETAKYKLRKHKTFLKRLWHDRATLNQKRELVLHNFSVVNNVLRSSYISVLNLIRGKTGINVGG